MACLLGVQRVPFHDCYLGAPVTVGRSKVQGRALSAAGKEVLIKSVAQAIPSYIMNCFEIPRSIISDIQSILARYWWGSESTTKRKIHWCSWERLCDNKRMGGLGFRDLHIFNLALLAKQGWRLQLNPSSMVAKLFKAKYHPDCSFMDAKCPSNASYTWRSILHGRQVLEVGQRYRIGDGMAVRFWRDSLLPAPYSFRPFSRPPEGCSDTPVGFFIDHANREWKRDLLCRFVTEYEADVISRIPLRSTHAPDSLMWHYDEKGAYSVKSGYWVFRDSLARNAASTSASSHDNRQQVLWKNIWSSHIPPKIKVFAWKLTHRFIPTKVALHRRHVRIEGRECALCGATDETEEHIFRDCTMVKEGWRSSMISDVVVTPSRLELKDWLFSVAEKLDSSRLDSFFTLLWTFWHYRNKVIWQDGVFMAQFIVKWAATYLDDYKQANEHDVGSKKQRLVAKWSCPPRGRLKLNADGAFDGHSNRGGIGVIARDETGVGITALAKPFDHALSPFMMEILALREGLHLAIRQGWSNIIIESDSILLISALQNKKVDLSENGTVIADCLELMGKLGTMSYGHIRREANQAADRLASVACNKGVSQVWIDIMPDVIQDVLLVDLIDCNNLARSIGPTSPQEHDVCTPFMNNKELRSVSNLDTFRL